MIRNLNNIYYSIINIMNIKRILIIWYRDKSQFYRYIINIIELYFKFQLKYSIIYTNIRIKIILLTTKKVILIIIKIVVE